MICGHQISIDFLVLHHCECAVGAASEARDAISTVLAWRELGRGDEKNRPKAAG